MNFDSRVKAVVGTASLIGLLAALAMGGGASGAGAASLPNCTVANNLEAIIDDSGSMSITDDQRFRVDMVNILAALNPDKEMGGVEFGSDAASLFLANPIGPNLTTIKTALNAVQADNGGTNYEQGFTVANSQNPSANARVFLSDGEPNDPDSTPDPNVWKVPNIKTYVIGFASVDPTVLAQIANDTGGPAPFNVTNTAQLRTVAAIINARINCEPDPIQITKTLKAGQVKGLSFGADGNTAQIVTSWTPGSKIQVFGFTQGGGGHASAIAQSAKKRGGHIRAKQTRGASYTVISLSNIHKGRVHFKIKAKKVHGKVAVTTAISP
jgi:von Willebrand factor type A domain-containing protein